MTWIVYPRADAFVFEVEVNNSPGFTGKKKKDSTALASLFSIKM